MTAKSSAFPIGSRPRYSTIRRPCAAGRFRAGTENLRGVREGRLGGNAPQSRYGFGLMRPKTGAGNVPNVVPWIFSAGGDDCWIHRRVRSASTADKAADGLQLLRLAQKDKVVPPEP